MTPPATPSTAVTEEFRALVEAAAWQATLADAELETCGPFELWLADPMHAQAWAEVQVIDAWWRAHAVAPEMLSARSVALNHAIRSRRHRYAGPRVTRRAMASAAMVLLAVFGTQVAWPILQTQVYETRSGERRTVLLPDGSAVAMDSNAKFQVRFDDGARRLELLRGQARFSVAHDAIRAFSVRAGDKLIVATGTNFNVDLLGPVVTVTLLEGKVDIFTEGRAVLPFRKAPLRLLTKLRPDQQFTAAPARGQDEPPDESTAMPSLFRVAEVDPQRAVAWEIGQLVFDDEPLGSVVARISRYSNRPLSVAPDAAQLRLSGVFNVGDSETFEDVVQRTLPVRADPDGAGGVRVSLRAN